MTGICSIWAAAPSAGPVFTETFLAEVLSARERSRVKWADDF